MEGKKGWNEGVREGERERGREGGRVRAGKRWMYYLGGPYIGGG